MRTTPLEDVLAFMETQQPQIVKGQSPWIDLGETRHLPWPFVCTRGIVSEISWPNHHGSILERFTLCRNHDYIRTINTKRGACRIHPVIIDHVLSTWRLGGGIWSMLHQGPPKHQGWIGLHPSWYAKPIAMTWRSMLKARVEEQRTHNYGRP